MVQELARLGDAHNVHITKIVYKANLHELHSKDYEFSNLSAKRHLMEGYINTKKMLANPNWWTDKENIGTFVHPNASDLDILIGNFTCRHESLGP